MKSKNRVKVLFWTFFLTLIVACATGFLENGMLLFTRSEEVIIRNISSHDYKPRKGIEKVVYSYEVESCETGREYIYEDEVSQEIDYVYDGEIGDVIKVRVCGNKCYPASNLNLPIQIVSILSLLISMSAYAVLLYKMIKNNDMNVSILATVFSWIMIPADLITLGLMGYMIYVRVFSWKIFVVCAGCWLFAILDWILCAVGKWQEKKS